MKIAYIITVYKLPDQLVRLVKRLNTNETSFFLHIDKKTDEKTYKRIVEQLGAYDKVHYLDRIMCNWGEFGQVKAPLNGIQEILAGDIQFDYVVLLTGQCYPIKSNQHIQEILQNCKGRSFINFFTPHDPLAIKWEDRISYWHFIWRRWHFVFPRTDMFSTSGLNRLWNPIASRITLRRKIPGNLQPFFGGSQWCLSREVIQYVNEFVQNHAAFVRFFSKFVEYPSEVFFQTILLNSPLKDQLINDDLKYMNWSSHKAHPSILRKIDFEKFMTTDDLFARKFDITIDRDVLDLIDRVIG